MWFLRRTSETLSFPHHGHYYLHPSVAVVNKTISKNADPEPWCIHGNIRWFQQQWSLHPSDLAANSMLTVPQGKRKHLIFCIQMSSRHTVLSHHSADLTTIWSVLSCLTNPQCCSSLQPPEASKSLKDCFESMDWNLVLQLQGNGMDNNIYTECITNYINFCWDTVTAVCRFPIMIPALSKTSREQFKAGKVRVQEKVEEKLKNNNTREVWRGMRTITGYKKESSLPIACDVDMTNELDQFFTRINTAPRAHRIPANTASHIPSSNTPAVISGPSYPQWGVTLGNAEATPLTPPSSLSAPHSKWGERDKRLCPGKPAGLDWVCQRLLMDYAAQLHEPL